MDQQLNVPEPKRPTIAAPSESRRPSRSRQLGEALRILSLFVSPSRRNARKVYEILATHNNLGDRTLFLNLGYWREAETYDDACRALAEQLGLAAELGEKDVVLDAGFGFGDQDLYWMERFAPQKIIGVNVTPLQIEVANRRVEAAGLSDRIALGYGSATSLPQPDSSVDKVVALESAFHFSSREAFFREAFRVLRPGGLIATADIVPLSGLDLSFRRRWLFEYIGRAFWQIPKNNMYSADVYAQKLEQAGFTHVTQRSIRREVFPPFRKFAQRRVRDPEVARRLNPLLRLLFASQMGSGQMSDGQTGSGDDILDFDYIIVTARKPAEKSLS